MSYRELGRYIEDLSRSGFDVVRLKVAWYSKLSFPLVSLTMAMIAIPFAFSTGRRGSLYGIGLSIVVGISYWVLQGFFEQIGERGQAGATSGRLGPQPGFRGRRRLFALYRSNLALGS